MDRKPHSVELGRGHIDFQYVLPGSDLQIRAFRSRLFDRLVNLAGTNFALLALKPSDDASRAVTITNQKNKRTFIGPLIILFDQRFVGLKVSKRSTYP